MNVRKMIKEELINEIIQEKELEYKGSTTYKDSFTFISQICNKDIFKDIDQYFFTCNLLPNTVEQHFNQYNEQDFTNKSIINAVQSFYQEDEFLKDIRHFKTQYEDCMDDVFIQVENMAINLINNNDTKGIELLKQLADNGYGYAYYELANLYEEANLVEKDMNKSLEYLKKGDEYYR